MGAETGGGIGRAGKSNVGMRALASRGVDCEAMRRIIADIVRTIALRDELERAHVGDVRAWIDSGAPLFRTAAPATPPKHLVAYFLVADIARRRVLLVDHVKAGLWLPSGGHVEPEEHPRATVVRELHEELGLEATFLAPEPLFVTITTTVGLTAGHTDVSLWYALLGDHTQPLAFDPIEFAAVAWFPIEALPLGRTDPHLARFVAKLASYAPQLA